MALTDKRTFQICMYTLITDDGTELFPNPFPLQLFRKLNTGEYYIEFTELKVILPEYLDKCKIENKRTYLNDYFSTLLHLMGLCESEEDFINSYNKTLLELSIEKLQLHAMLVKDKEIDRGF